MRIASVLCLALLLGACGDAPSSEPPKNESDTTVVARDTPLQKGDVAPGFSALPEGKSVLVFYRGKW
jgi:hypothetical protein